MAYEVTTTGDFGAATGAAMATFLASNATVQVSVATTDDSTHEAHGSVTVTLQAGASYELGTDAAATVAVRGRRQRGADGRGDDRRHDAGGGRDARRGYL